ncbi:TIGR02466 family protein [Pelagibius marinus]|uniref:TIGR02466 family protein n=1 Tax=Pelagibius marinus TaxID=2762760 RepID=UPI00187264D8|nr:TIGR02466 family protein [Pelagibius marinus]
MKINDFKNAAAMQFFPTLVWRQELPPARAEAANNRLLAAIDKQLTPRPAQTAGVGWQTAQDLHLQPAFADLAKVIVEAGEAALKSIEAEHNGLTITGCWANVNPPEARHRAHTHPNNFLSGVYYVRAPQGGNHISFTDPRVQCAVMQPRYRKDNVLNASVINLEVADGVMILFPSWLQHDVRRNASNEERVTIAFNLMLNDYIETISPPIWTPSGT